MMDMESAGVDKLGNVLLSVVIGGAFVIGLLYTTRLPHNDKPHSTS
jgi:hypothetical protein